MRARGSRWAGWLTLLILAGASLLIGLPAPSAAGSAAPAGRTPQTAAASAGAYGQLPLRFEANRGQSDPEVRFLARTAGGMLFLTERRAVIELASPSPLPAGPGTWSPLRAQPRAATRAVVTMEAVGSNPSPRMDGVDPLPGLSNYLTSADPATWHVGVPGYARVRYHELLPGIDLVYHGERGQLEYDLLVAPGADPGLVRLAFRGQDDLAIDDGGDLVVHAAGAELRQPRPAIYQEGSSGRVAVAGGYRLSGAGGVTLAVGDYDRTRSLVIDPQLIYSTYLGGSSADAGSAIAIDRGGYAYVTGRTNSADFPVEPAAGTPPSTTNSNHWVAFVTRFVPSGNAVVYSTFLGTGGLSDAGSGIGVDSAGNAYVAGQTSSSSFPTHNAVQDTNREGHSKAFLTQLNPTGQNVIYSTYLGGDSISPPFSSNGAMAVALDGAGHAFVTGGTNAPNFPTTPGAYQEYPTWPGGCAFVTELDTTKAGRASLVWSSYLSSPGTVDEGGSPLGGDVATGGIAVDSTGDIDLAGTTGARDLPVTTNGYQDSNLEYGQGGQGHTAFVIKLDPRRPGDAARVYSTYLGGRGAFDGAEAIAADHAGAVYVTGSTGSTSFPTKDALQPNNRGSSRGAANAFVTKIDTLWMDARNPRGSIVYSTYLGGTPPVSSLSGEAGHGIAVDSFGNAYVVGETYDYDFPTKGDPCLIVPVLTKQGPFQTGFVSKINRAGSGLVYSTYLGGNVADIVFGVAVSPGGESAFVTGSTNSPNFPVRNPYQPVIGDRPTPGGPLPPEDAFVSRIADGCGAPPGVTSVVPNSGPASGMQRVTIGGVALSAASAVNFGPSRISVPCPMSGQAPTAPCFSVAAGALDLLGRDLATSITAYTPPHVPGTPWTVHVVVETPAGTSAPTPLDLYTYLQPPPCTVNCGSCVTNCAPPGPSLSGVQPGCGVTAGNERVALTGSGFVVGARVSFDSLPGTAPSVAPGGALIAVTTPAHPAGLATVTVTNPDGQSSALAQAFSFSPSCQGQAGKQPLRASLESGGPLAARPPGSHVGGLAPTTPGTPGPPGQAPAHLVGPFAVQAPVPVQAPGSALSQGGVLTNPGGASWEERQTEGAAESVSHMVRLGAGFDPAIALAPGGLALAGCLVLAWRQRRPRQLAAPGIAW